MTGPGRSAMRSAFFYFFEALLASRFLYARTGVTHWRVIIKSHMRLLDFGNLTQFLRLLYFIDLHRSYKASGNFRFFYVVPLHCQTKTTGQRTCFFRPSFDYRSTFVRQMVFECQKKIKGNERRITKRVRTIFNIAIKQEQSQACLSYAEREQCLWSECFMNYQLSIINYQLTKNLTMFR